MKYEIRQLGIGAILDQAIKLIQNHFKPLFGIVLALLIPFTLLMGFVQMAMMPAMPPADASHDAKVAYINAVAVAPIYTVPFALILVYFVIPLTNAALIHAIARAYLGQSTGTGQALRLAGQRIVPLIWTWFLMGLAIFGGLLLCVVPGILVALWFAMATQVVVLEGLSGFDALKRSRSLMKGNLGKLFALGLIVGVINFTMGVVPNFIPQPHLKVVLSALAQGIATVFASATGVLFYFSTRCQHENFDLDLLAESVAAAEAPASPEANLL